MSGDLLKLSIAAKPASISAVRMFISAVAARLDFSINRIDDIRTAVSEGCTLAMRSLPQNIDIEVIADSSLNVKISAAGQTTAGDKDADEFSMMLISAMADEVDLKKDGDRICGFEMVFNVLS